MNELKEGKLLCEADAAEKEKESQIINFKKRLFA